jgi:BirA family biotin operon repressor/biotin-[acetyl-CoA-carboxylase] ligase
MVTHDATLWSARDPLPARIPARGPFGAAFAFHPSVGSTNDLARAAAAQGAPEGLVIAADEQTAGRGRHGRRWESPPGASLLCSILLRPDLPPSLAPRAGTYVALAAATAIEEATGIPIALKWPNDLLVGGRKVAGVLAESGSMAEHLDFVVVGLGLNVHWHPDDPTTTALDAAAGRILARRDLLVALLTHLARWRPHLEPDPRDRLLGAWRGRLVTLGRAVVVRGPDLALEGRAVRVERDGGLVVRDAAGAEHVVHAADVTLRAASP